MTVRRLINDGQTEYTFINPYYPIAPPFLIGDYSHKIQQGSNSSNGFKSENPYTMYYKRTSYPKGTYRFVTDDTTIPFPREGTFRYLFGEPSPIDEWSSNDDIELLNKVNEKWSNGDFNAAVFSAEAKESMVMIGDTAKKLATSFTRLKHGNFRGAAHALGFDTYGRNSRTQGGARKKNARAIRDYWMELQYGWKPLLGDAKSAAETLAAQVYKHNNIIIRAGKRVEGSVICGAPDTVTPKGTFVHGKRLKVYFARGSSLMHDLHLDDPFTLAWETYPLSFVVDWFLPIGDYISALENSFQMPVTKVVTSEKTELYCDTALFADIGSRPTIISASLPFVHHEVTLKRTVTDGLPFPPLPSFNKWEKTLSWQHALSGIALLSQAFK